MNVRWRRHTHPRTVTLGRECKRASSRCRA